MDQHDLVADLAQRDPEMWFKACALIKDKRAGDVRGPKPNILQRRMFLHYRECQLAQKPCLMAVLKPRQVGASTGTQGILYHHNQRYQNLNGSLMGDIEKTSNNVFEIYRRYAENDIYPWSHFTGSPIQEGWNNNDEIRLASGSTIVKETAGSTNAGRSNTVQVINMTEVAHFPETKSINPILGYLNSFYDESPMSLGIADSTPNGPKGWFYKICSSKKSDWKLIFAAWFEFPEHSAPIENDDEREALEADLDMDEREEIERYGVSLEQLKWRRNKIENKCEGDPLKFKQEYPSDPMTCFLLSARNRFNTIKLASLKQSARTQNPIRGEFVVQGIRTSSFQPDALGQCYMAESPKIGCKYLVAADSATGEDQQSSQTGSDPDWHSIGVLRAGYFDPQKGQFTLPRLVAYHYSRLDIDIAAEYAAAMAFYYGNCIIVPEVNNCGLAMVKQLEKLEANLWHRQRVSRTRGVVDKSAGWNTDKSTRKTIIDELARMIRQDEIDIPFPKVIEQMERFVINSSGTFAAMPGFHDDDVLMLAIGAYNLEAATEYKMPKRKRVSQRRLRNDRTYMVPDGWTRG